MGWGFSYVFDKWMFANGSICTLWCSVAAFYYLRYVFKSVGFSAVSLAQMLVAASLMVTARLI